MPDYKLTIHDLCIETTRRCNMACAHCMRGDAMNRDLDPALLDKLFSKLSGIGNVTPTGGEPSLNPAALLQIRDAILKYNIPVAGVYLVTNGKEITDEFLHNFLSLLLATEMDPEVSGLALSQDMFHDKISYKNKAKLSMFSCFRDDDKKTDWTRTPVLNIGRGAEIVIVSNRDPYRPQNTLNCWFNNDTIQLSEVLTLTVDGYLLPYGDYSYEEVENLAICNVNDPDWYEQLIAEILSQNPKIESEISA